jgi:hypothetical protein
LSAFGITTELQPGWEGRITRRNDPTPESVAPSSAGPGRAGARGWPGEHAHPVVHLANFALPATRGDFGSGAVEMMGPANLLVVLVEYGPESLGTALFAAEGIPSRLQPSDFDPRGLQRILPGQAGAQRFFTVAGRAFCVYVVLGGRVNAARLVGQANRALAATTIGPP